MIFEPRFNHPTRFFEGSESRPGTIASSGFCISLPAVAQRAKAGLSSISVRRMFHF
ncbi:MAG: hypothetical protein UY76_C0048G0002 [Candidatus Uhrbacteria bacterium GW2011_GWA2_52_8d]|uniref:Uncharacterized protein n=1 Tax=Candidatus Uhrbacteria bacterium GW2011_GWA2_52_8d TaxID=1618979 RepID=A0A0G2AH27_9BACT|nr:MAG: hypothetical protein UY76_C0048G0002 [Candidatus Uhrbacteria bacterium GW2011_GWA2_52_8d]